MFNNPRDTFGIAQFLLGQSINTTDLKEWDEAIAKLKEQNPLVSSYVMDEVFNKMESGEYAFATYYAGDFELMNENNPDLDFVFPEEGVNTFYDAMCIPKSTQNKKGAEAFINFMMEPEIALANAEYIYYASPNRAVLENPDYSLVDSGAVYPESVKGQVFHNLPEDTLQYMNTLWTRVKSENDTSGLYVGFFSVLAVIVVLIVLNVLKKARMKKFYNV
jgi:spermidine/putrescine transport system substrate-binding protein